MEEEGLEGFQHLYGPFPAGTYLTTPTWWEVVHSYEALPPRLFQPQAELWAIFHKAYQEGLVSSRVAASLYDATSTVEGGFYDPQGVTFMSVFPPPCTLGACALPPLLRARLLASSASPFGTPRLPLRQEEEEEEEEDSFPGEELTEWRKLEKEQFLVEGLFLDLVPEAAVSQKMKAFLASLHHFCPAYSFSRPFYVVSSTPPENPSSPLGKFVTTKGSQLLYSTLAGKRHDLYPLEAGYKMALLFLEDAPFGRPLEDFKEVKKERKKGDASP